VRILVIEDNEANLELMTYLLTAFGHTPLPARDGIEGILKARTEAPDLILCDIQLPRMDGYEILRRLRADETCRGIPTVAVTAFAMVGDRDQILASGFDGYLSKPIDTELFVQQIESFRGERQSRLSTDAAETPAKPARPAKILVVDNWQVNLDLARGVLEPHGYEVTATSSSREALARVSEELPDLILSDMAMAESSGFDFIRTVKANPRLANIPFVFISSTFVDEEHQQKALALGAARYLIRPLDPQDLLAAIEECLGRPRTPPA
jgi:two-component system cell cycle response regulator